MQAELITIGDEILIGQIVDTNSAWMAAQLNRIGVNVKQITSVSDERTHIIEALGLAQQRAGIVLITGGLGPTKDDITKQTLAEYFNMPLRRDEETLKNVTTLFARFKRPLTEVNRRQADVPEGCTVIQNKNGSAPCMWFEHDGKIVVSMPGVPFEMMYLMEEEVLPMIKARFALPHIIHKTILTAGAGESFLAEKIEAVENALPPAIKLAYLPKLGQVRLRLSGSGNDHNKLKAEIDQFSGQITALIAEFVVAETDITIEEVVLNFMEARGLTLSTAESCTGGYIGHLITQHPGCSAVYYGGAISYAYELKESVLGVQHDTLATYGAVSEQTVKEMAAGALKHFHTDYAIAVSGIAGPGGATPDKPAGTVWIAIAGKHGVTAKLFEFTSRRQQNIERSAAAALTMLLKQLKQDYN